MKNKIVTIYCLYNPQTLKIRYIGRTTTTLNERLSRHISKAKHYSKHFPNSNGSYKTNWIKSLLKDGIRPKIRFLTTVQGWEESHIFEKSLIQKYLVKHNLTNGDDRGPGSFAKNIDPINEKRRIKKLKEHFNKEENKQHFYKKVYVYNTKGDLIDEYKSVKFIESRLNISKEKVTYYMNSVKRGCQIKPVNGLYFSHKKYIKYPFLRPEEALNRTIIYIGENKYESLLDLKRKNSLSSWDIDEIRKLRFTKRVKILFKGSFIKIIKNGNAVLERNF